MNERRQFGCQRCGFFVPLDKAKFIGNNGTIAVHADPIECGRLTSLDYEMRHKAIKRKMLRDRLVARATA